MPIIPDLFKRTQNNLSSINTFEGKIEFFALGINILSLSKEIWFGLFNRDTYFWDGNYQLLMILSVIAFLSLFFLLIARAIHILRLKHDMRPFSRPLKWLYVHTIFLVALAVLLIVVYRTPLGIWMNRLAGIDTIALVSEPEVHEVLSVKEKLEGMRKVANMEVIYSPRPTAASFGNTPLQDFQHRLGLKAAIEFIVDEPQVEIHLFPPEYQIRDYEPASSEDIKTGIGLRVLEYISIARCEELNFNMVSNVFKFSLGYVQPNTELLNLLSQPEQSEYLFCILEAINELEDRELKLALSSVGFEPLILKISQDPNYNQDVRNRARYFMAWIYSDQQKYDQALLELVNLFQQEKDLTFRNKIAFLLGNTFLSKSLTIVDLAEKNALLTKAINYYRNISGAPAYESRRLKGIGKASLLMNMLAGNDELTQTIKGSAITGRLALPGELTEAIDNLEQAFWTDKDPCIRQNTYLWLSIAYAMTGNQVKPDNKIQNSARKLTCNTPESVIILEVIPQWQKQSLSIKIGIPATNEPTLVYSLRMDCAKTLYNLTQSDVLPSIQFSGDPTGKVYQASFDLPQAIYQSFSWDGYSQANQLNARVFCSLGVYEGAEYNKTLKQEIYLTFTRPMEMLTEISPSASSPHLVGDKLSLAVHFVTVINDQAQYEILDPQALQLKIDAERTQPGAPRVELSYDPQVNRYQATLELAEAGEWQYQLSVKSSSAADIRLAESSFAVSVLNPTPTATPTPTLTHTPFPTPTFTPLPSSTPIPPLWIGSVDRENQSCICTTATGCEDECSGSVMLSSRCGIARLTNDPQSADPGNFVPINLFTPPTLTRAFVKLKDLVTKFPLDLSNLTRDNASRYYFIKWPANGYNDEKGDQIKLKRLPACSIVFYLESVGDIRYRVALLNENLVETATAPYAWINIRELEQVSPTFFEQLLEK